jgi:hypothetical protein
MLPPVFHRDRKDNHVDLLTAIQHSNSDGGDKTDLWNIGF